MADLEEMGFVASPHTSAGRVPTPKGYRFFVDTLLTVRPLEEVERAQIEEQPPARRPAPGGGGRLAAAVGPHALRGRGGVAPAPRAALRHIEFFHLSEKRVLLIIVASDGEVQNRVLVTDRPYTPGAARRGGQRHQPALRRPGLRPRSRAGCAASCSTCTSDISALMRAAIETGGEAMRQPADGVVISGESATCSRSRTSPPTGRGCASSSTSSRRRPSSWGCSTRASAPRA